MFNYLLPGAKQALTVIKILGAFLAADPVTGLGTIFGPPEKDPHNPGGPACVRRDRPPPTPFIQYLMDNGEYVAHKTLPCYQLLYICVPRNGNCRITVVGDRGPLHADIDLYEGLATRIEHNGREKVVWSLIGEPNGAKGSKSARNARRRRGVQEVK